MKKRKSYDRHTLLPYQRSVNRIWKITLLLAIVLLVAWWWLPSEGQVGGLVSTELILLAAGMMALVITIFFFVARYLAYVKPYQKYLKVVTPFMRMNISYRRMRGVRPVLVQQIFPKDEISRSQRNTLEPYYGKTALILELKSFPVDESVLKLLMPSSMFSSQFKGLVLIVPDWMKLSTEIDTLRGTQTKSIKDRYTPQNSMRW